MSTEPSLQANSQRSDSLEESRQSHTPNDPLLPVAASGLMLDKATLSELSRANLLRQYIYHKVLEEVLDGTPVDAETFSQLRANYRRTNALVDDQAEANLRMRLGFSPDDLRWQIELPLRVNRYCVEHFLPKAEARFLDRKNSLDQVTYSLLRLRDGALARELYHRILEGEASFADLAREFSEGSERSTNGIVGPAPLAQGHPLLVKRLRSAQPGDLIPPFQVEQWWLVVRLESYRPATLDEAMRQRMAQELFDEWIQAETTTRIAALSSASPRTGS